MKMEIKSGYEKSGYEHSILIHLDTTDRYGQHHTGLHRVYWLTRTQEWQIRRCLPGTNQIEKIGYVPDEMVVALDALRIPAEAKEAAENPVKKIDGRVYYRGKYISHDEFARKVHAGEII